MADNDFERLCAAYWNAAEVPMGNKHWPPDDARDATDCRRGVAALLRELREPSEAMKQAMIRSVGMEGGIWYAGIDAILQQAPDEAGRG